MMKNRKASDKGVHSSALISSRTPVLSSQLRQRPLSSLPLALPPAGVKAASATVIQEDKKDGPVSAASAPSLDALSVLSEEDANARMSVQMTTSASDPGGELPSTPPLRGATDEGEEALFRSPVLKRRREATILRASARTLSLSARHSSPPPAPRKKTRIQSRRGAREEAVAASGDAAPPTPASPQ